jgi:hypothetical protein
MSAGCFLALTAYLATGLFLHLSYARYFWLMLAIADSVAIVAARRAAETVLPDGQESDLSGMADRSVTNRLFVNP